MTAGRILGLDYGTRRVGVAVSDPGQSIALPVVVIARDEIEVELPTLLHEYQPVAIVVGMPTSLSGAQGPAVEASKAFAEEVRIITGLDVEFYDERFSTVVAERALSEGQIPGRRRRAVVDKVAATVMLQGYLDHKA